MVGPWMVNSYIREGKNIGTAVMPTFGDVPATWTNTHCLALTVQDSDENYLNSMKVVKWFLENYAEPGIQSRHRPGIAGRAGRPLLDRS